MVRMLAVFPTSVGMNRVMLPDVLLLACVPHKRGDEPRRASTRHPL